MNEQIFRLILDVARGMYVPVAECQPTRPRNTRSSEDTSVAARVALAVALAGATGLAMPEAAWAQRAPRVFAPTTKQQTMSLPQPYGAATGRTDRSFVADPKLAPRVSWSVNGNQATFNQGDVDRVILNWDRFDIGTGYRVHFSQNTDPTRYVSALNRIWSSDPSVILGSLTADREVILVNANGIYFGRGARVDTGKFVATSLGISDAVFEKGIRNAIDGSAVFTSDGTDYVATNRDGMVAVEAGAELRTAANGDVLLIAPRVVNEGRIETPRGQAILAAGSRVYLMSSSDPAQRGLIVGVDPYKLADSNDNDPALGIVENAATGSYTASDAAGGLVTRINEIAAESGTINLVGLTVRQDGNLRATTAVRGANGAIYLQAQSSTVLVGTTGNLPLARYRGLTIDQGGAATIGDGLGTVELGAGSSTVVSPADDGATQLDSEVFNRSRIRVEGSAIHVAGGADLRAPSGDIQLLAAESAERSQLFREDAPFVVGADSSRIVIDPGARLDAAGLRDITVDGARNQGNLRLFRIELADAPVQRSGPLYRSAVYFDLRDGSKIETADVTGAANAIGRTAIERSTAGGSIDIEGEGAIVIGSGAELDVSGGSIAYSAATLQTSLLGYAGRVRLFDAADKSLNYQQLYDGTAQRVVPAYVEGKDGGSLRVNGRHVAMAAQVQGSVLEGPYQRDGRAERAAPSELIFGRREANGGLYLPGVRLDAETPYLIDPAVFAAALTAPLDDVPGTLDYSSVKLQASGIGRLTLVTGTVEQAGPGRLDLGPGGAFSVDANTITLDGAFIAPGGRIELRTSLDGATEVETAGDITLSSRTVLDTAGTWTNDLPNQRATAVAPIVLDGGNVEVSAVRSVRAAQGSTLDASSGAWLDAGGKLHEGKAGSLSLRSAAGLPLELVSDTTLELGATLRAYDFAAGGSLTLNVPQSVIVGDAAEGVSLKPDFFSQGGFSSITIESFGGVRFLAGTTVAPVLHNWLLTPTHRTMASGAMLERAVTPVPVDTRLVERKPVSLAFAAAAPISQSSDLSGGSVIVERGAIITLEPGGSLNLQAARNVEIGVTGGQPGEKSVLNAPGGEIRLHIAGVRGAVAASDDPVGFIPDQAIWLGSDSLLSVAGTAVLRPDTTGAPLFQFGAPASTPRTRVTGSVLGGGNIDLIADRGYVIAEAGSAMNLDGASASLNLPGLAQAVMVAKPAGTLTVSTPEGFVLDGAVSARGPVDAAGKALADGGRLDLQVAPGGVRTLTQGAAYPDRVANPRQISVDLYEDLLAEREVSFGDDLNAALGNGIGYANQRLLDASGFDALHLGAGDKVQFERSMQLAPRLALEIDAPAIAAVPGSQVVLNSTRVAIGDRMFRVAPADSAARPDESPDGSTSLTINATTIDVAGTSGLQGFSEVSLNADRTRDGEVRLIGAPRFVGRETGRLNFAGTLAVRAGQMYATSDTDFTVSGSEDSTLIITQPDGGSTSRVPLSALATLTVNATDIVQDGVLRQPFGSISLNATETLALGANSLTSVSGEGSVIPYGTTANLTQWFGPAADVDLSAASIEKRIMLSAPEIVTDANARVSGSGGGDIQAWEFFPGVGGSTDYLDTPGLYAVLPYYSPAFAPSNELAADDAMAASGLQIEITMAGSGLPPGRYTLLPARYALLAGSLPQGAFLVSPAADQGSTVLASPIHRDDGSVVVTGYISQAGSANTGQPGERFIVEPQATYSAKSDIRLTGISNLQDSRAASLGTTALNRPRDAALLQVEAGAATTWLTGSYDLSAPEGAREGQWDVVAPSIAVVDRAAQTPEGSVGIDASSLSASGAGSVLLGGLRSTADSDDPAVPAITIDGSRTAEVVVLAVAKPIEVQELLLAATDKIAVADGVRLQAGSHATQGERKLQLSGDGAFVAVSADVLDTQRTDAALTKGSVAIGRDVQLAGTTVSLDATQSLMIDASAKVHAGALALGAPHIVVGAASDDDGATLLDGALLTTVQQASDLTLRSYSSIDFVGEQNWSERPRADASQKDPAPIIVLERLTLDSPVVRGLDGVDADGNTVAARTDLAAVDVVLRNTSGIAPQQDLTGQGSLRIEALPPLRHGETGGLTLGPGQQTLNFATAELVSHGDAVLAGSGGLQAQGDLSVAAARITAATGADQELAAGGALVLDGLAGSRTLGERVGQGAAVTFRGETIAQRGTVDLPAGIVAFQATGKAADDAAIVFDVGSMTYAGGFVTTPQDGWNVFGSGGSVSATADTGRIAILGTVDVSAARASDGSSRGDAGRIVLAATGEGGHVELTRTGMGGDGQPVQQQGALLGRGGDGDDDLGGRLGVDVRTHDAAADGASVLDSLAAQASGGGFSREVDIRVRSGDVTLAGDLKSQRIVIAADEGSLAIDGARLDASADAGGVVQLFAGEDVRLGGGTVIDARSRREGANGGDVLLSSVEGWIRIADDARIVAGGDDAPDGRIVLRALRGTGSVNVDKLNVANLDAAEVDIEAVRVYRTVTVGTNTRDITQIVAGNSSIQGTNGRLGQASVQADSTAYMAQASAILDELGVATEDQDRVFLRAGVEVQASGELAIGADWALNNARPGGDAGFLTLRAAANLNVNNSISDGFTTTTNTTAATSGVLNNNARSWSMRLAGGADLSAANPLAVIDHSQSAVETGNVTIAATRFVRTGAGSIEIAAGRDLRFAGTAAQVPGAVYVAGRKHADQDAVLADLFLRQTAKPTFTEQGGRLELSAVRDITAPAPNRMINNWLWRTGLPASGTNEAGLYAINSHLAWWTQFNRFQQTAGSFGGGNVRVQSGRDISNLAVMAPTAAWADSRERATANLVTVNGGDIEVSAGGSVLGGQYFTGRGTGRIEARGEVGQSTSGAVRAPILAAMDSSWRVDGREGVAIAAAINPTASPTSSQDNRTGISPLFYTYAQDSSVTLSSAAGDITLAGGIGSALSAFQLDTQNADGTRLLQVAPPSLSIAAPGGDVQFGIDSLLLYPSSNGDFKLYAQGDMQFGGAGTAAAVAMADVDPDSWPTARNPMPNTAGKLFVLDQIALALGSRVSEGGVPVVGDGLPHAGLHRGDPEPARVSAGGSIVMSDRSSLNLPKPAQIEAGLDITNLTYIGLNLHADDVTTIKAERNFTELTGGVLLAGPGALEITAGRQIDLGPSLGVTTSGNLNYPSGPAQGASIRMTAGANGTLNLAAFDTTYLQAPDNGGSARWETNRQMLLDFVRAELATPSLDYDAALALFADFPESVQRKLARDVLNAEFGATYLAGAASTEVQMLDALRTAFEDHRASILAAGQAALGENRPLTLPGNEVLAGAELQAYLAELGALSFEQFDLAQAVTGRVAALARYQPGWHEAVAASLGGTAAEFETLGQGNPADPRYQQYQAALGSFSGPVFERYRDRVLTAEIASAGATAADFGIRGLPMRQAFYDQGFAAAELAGAGNFEAQPYWQGKAPAFDFSGALNMTQSSVITRRGGDISLVAPGGPVNVGLKQLEQQTSLTGVIALGGGDIFGFARDDFQVNDQRVFIVGRGDMTLWSSTGDIDSGRGANTAVGAPPLRARRSADGVVFELPPTTTGSGLGILPDGSGALPEGTIGLYPALGEILALDAFIRAPSVIVGSTVRGSDNLISAAISGATAPVAAPTMVTPSTPPPSTQAAVEAAMNPQNSENRPSSSLLTVELLGLGADGVPDDCKEDDEREACKKARR